MVVRFATVFADRNVPIAHGDKIFIGRIFGYHINSIYPNYDFSKSESEIYLVVSHPDGWYQKNANSEYLLNDKRLIITSKIGGGRFENYKNIENFDMLQDDNGHNSLFRKEIYKEKLDKDMLFFLNGGDSLTEICAYIKKMRTNAVG